MLRSFRVSLESLGIFRSKQSISDGHVEIQSRSPTQVPQGCLSHANRMVRAHYSNVQTEQEASQASRHRQSVKLCSSIFRKASTTMLWSSASNTRIFAMFLHPLDRGVNHKRREGQIFPESRNLGMGLKPPLRAI